MPQICLRKVYSSSETASLHVKEDLRSYNKYQTRKGRPKKALQRIQDQILDEQSNLLDREQPKWKKKKPEEKRLNLHWRNPLNRWHSACWSREWSMLIGKGITCSFVLKAIFSHSLFFYYFLGLIKLDQGMQNHTRIHD